MQANECGGQSHKYAGVDCFFFAGVDCFFARMAGGLVMKSYTFTDRGPVGGTQVIQFWSLWPRGLAMNSYKFTDRGPVGGTQVI